MEVNENLKQIIHLAFFFLAWDFSSSIAINGHNNAPLFSAFWEQRLRNEGSWKYFSKERTRFCYSKQFQRRLILKENENTD